MKQGKLKVGILFGGRSPEHKISLLSASNVIERIDRSKFDVVLLPIDKDGTWYIQNELSVVHPGDAKNITLTNLEDKVILSQNTGEHSIISLISGKEIAKIDVLYPILHGINGEDGSIQGLAKVAGIPCVGCGILSSSACMDKDITKRLLRDANIPNANFLTLRKGYNDELSYYHVSKKLGEQLYIKPANLGSSVGVSLVKNEDQYNDAIRLAFQYDHKVIVEERIIGKEIECAVLGNLDPKASVIGEILPKTEWYTFENKYVDDDGAGLEIPAKISDELSEKARKLAVETYRTLDCSGLARVDMFLKEDGTILVNEVNTIPGFTSISMYPKLWNATNLDYENLISKLIFHAVEKYKSEDALII